MKKVLRLLIFIWGGVLYTFNAGAQDVALKTNLFYDATATANLGLEVAVSPKWTIEASGNYNNWTMSRERRWKHWMIQPEGRYWLCNKYIGHFFGVHVHGGQYNFGNLQNNLKFLWSDFSPLSEDRFQGWFLGKPLCHHP